MFWFGMMGLGRLIRSVTNSRRKRNYKKSKDLIEIKTKEEEGWDGTFSESLNGMVLVRP